MSGLGEMLPMEYVGPLASSGALALTGCNPGSLTPAVDCNPGTKTEGGDCLSQGSTTSGGVCGTGSSTGGARCNPTGISMS